jgi:aquaporin Z
MNDNMMKSLMAECFGTFCLVFAGTGAIVINDVSGGAVTHVGVALTFGLVVLAAMLMFVILRVSSGAKEKGITAGLVVGAVVALEALFAGPVCGASMNPARSFAPAMVAGQWQHLWLYLVAPTAGALLGVVLCRLMREPGCCAAPKRGND